MPTKPTPTTEGDWEKEIWRIIESCEGTDYVGADEIPIPDFNKYEAKDLLTDLIRGLIAEVKDFYELKMSKTSTEARAKAIEEAIGGLPLCPSAWEAKGLKGAGSLDDAWEIGWEQCFDEARQRLNQLKKKK